MTSFTPVSSLIGGVLIGLSATLLLVLNGRVAGICGILSAALKPRAGDFAWRALFLLGLVVGGGLLAVLRPDAITSIPGQPMAVVVVAGLLVGFGTSLGNGCTSGHGVCGISRWSQRSIVATAVFMATGAATVFVMRHVIGSGS
jgi:uncharacterized membrane protein YedE/YeeE